MFVVGLLLGQPASWSPPSASSIGQLWLVYLGYGVIGGIGLGIGYISPVSTLIKWFPDRPGLATGMAIMGFGGGALIASPVSTQLLPGTTRLQPGRRQSVASGERWSAVPDPRRRLLLVMMFGAFTIRVPGRGWKPEGFDPATVKAAKPLVTTANVSAANAIQTRVVLAAVDRSCFCNVTAGIGILEQAAPMIQDFFREPTARRRSRPRSAAGFVGLLSHGQHGRPVRLVRRPPT